MKFFTVLKIEFCKMLISIAYLFRDNEINLGGKYESYEFHPNSNCVHVGCVCVSVRVGTPRKCGPLINRRFYQIPTHLPSTLPNVIPLSVDSTKYQSPNR